MTATVRLDDILEDKLNSLSIILHKKKSDVIREAIAFYAKSIEKSRKDRIISAVKKTKKADAKESELFEGTLNDGI